MKNRHLVSVIIATYNRCELLKFTIKSILEQSYDNFELIIVDDGSTDDTKNICLCFNDDRIHYIYSDNSGSPARPRNIGIKLARGEFIAFCDDDDIWMPNKLDVQIDSFTDGVLGVGANMIYFGKLSKYKRINFTSMIYKDFIAKDILVSGGVPLSSLVLKNGNNIYFDVDDKYHDIEDLEYQFRYLTCYDGIIRMVGEPLVKYRITDQNNNTNNYINRNAVRFIAENRDLLTYSEYNATLRNRYYGYSINALRSADKNIVPSLLFISLRYSLKNRINFNNLIMILKIIIVCIISFLPLSIISSIMTVYYLIINNAIRVRKLY